MRERVALAFFSFFSGGRDLLRVARAFLVGGRLEFLDGTCPQWCAKLGGT